MSCLLYSLGHSTHPIERFVELCNSASIETVCDIRRFPRSRRNPQFTREHLELELPSRGIAYQWLGEELGGFREDGYEDWMESDAFERGSLRLQELASERVAGFMCSEGSPDRCHRRFVAIELASRGHRVAHLLPAGEIVWVQPTLGLPNR